MRDLCIPIGQTYEPYHGMCVKYYFIIMCGVFMHRNLVRVFTYKTLHICGIQQNKT